MTLALKEWHVVSEAIARGDQVLTLRKGGIREKSFALPGTEFWLLPTWEHQDAAEVKRAWHGELRRSQRQRPAGDDAIPIRCRCRVAAAFEIVDERVLERLDDWHLWTRAYVAGRLRWRPTQPLTALLLRAEALLDPVVLAPDAERYGGCRSWVELPAAPAADGLIPALTDDAFALRARAIGDLLGEPGAVPA